MMENNYKCYVNEYFYLQFSFFFTIFATLNIEKSDVKVCNN